MIDSVRRWLGMGCMSIAAGFMLLGMKIMPVKTPDAVSGMMKASMKPGGFDDMDELLEDVLDDEQIQEAERMIQAQKEAEFRRYLEKRQEEDDSTATGTATCTDCGHEERTEISQSAGMGLHECSECGHEFVVSIQQN